MVLVQRGPQDTGKEYPRTVEDASLPSSSSSRPPLRRVSFLFSSACLPSVLLSLFSPCKYAPSDSHKDLYSQREPSSPSNATHQEGYHLPLSCPLSLSLSLSPSRSLFHFFFFFLREFPSIPPRFSSIASIYVPRDFRANYEIKGACSRALHVKRHVTTRETTLKFGDKRNQTASSMPNETEYLRV